ncbi:bifunctional homocysteine S-methyltransferase/methylenetetrahydrofolate reductase [Sinobaca sp. H24]|uniref:bifunctional homocysteine S-methyltransferase/methylenetetrahydrofolate reductase n=1 Tax=Sinobaca sp. H24 TaxID=2923376 RepID=UPI00207A22BF|nr:bifunctional homocysteine S-methyltransferase/methylenetetrahydrofolate reductase [Sinobaca sp. H24]
MNLAEEYSKRMLIGDGAMGTYLYEKGYSGSYEALNISEPGLVKNIHKEYVEAGSDIIQTNTYAANRIKLAKYQLEDKAADINRLGVETARAAAEGRAFVFATIGGIKGLQKMEENDEDIRSAFSEQLDALLKAEPDGIILETFYDLQEILSVIKLAKSKTNLPVIAQVALGEVGVMHSGMPLGEAFKQMTAAGADAVGVNCRMGPYHILRSLEMTPLDEHTLYAVHPNASLPDIDDGRFVYQSNPDYFYEKALDFQNQGIGIIGGCCGTTPEHIAQIAAAVKNTAPKTRTAQAVAQKAGQFSIVEPPSSEPSLREKAKQSVTVIVELDPPKKLATSKFVEGAQALYQSGADAVTMADNSLASPRIDNLAMGALVKSMTQARPLLHVACRDRNLIGLQSHLMGINALGIHDILAVTGDPTKVGDFPGATSVYDANSFDLIQLMKEMNKGLSFSGKSLGQNTTFTVGAAFNPNVRNVDRAVQRLEKKITAGADYFMTQPVFGEGQFKEIYEATKHMDVPVYIGIMPLVSSRNAEFLHNEVPGIKLTDTIRRSMADCGEDRGRAAEEGIAIAKTLIDEAMEYFNGIYLITPFLRYDITCRLTEYIREKASVRIEEKSK